IDVSRRKLLRYDAELGQYLARDAADAEFKAAEIVDRLDLLAEPAAHLRRRVAERDAVDAEGFVELVQEIKPAAIGQPRIHLASVEAEGHGGAEGKRQILADVIVRGAIAHLDGAVSNRVEHLEGRHDLVWTVDADLELVVREIGDPLGEHLAGAIE